MTRTRVERGRLLLTGLSAVGVIALAGLGTRALSGLEPSRPDPTADAAPETAPVATPTEPSAPPQTGPLRHPALAALGLPVFGSDGHQSVPTLALTNDSHIAVIADGQATQWPLPESAAGDPPHRVTARQGGLVLYGRSGAWLQDPDTGRARLLGPARFHFPALRRDAVWLVNDHSAGFELTETSTQGAVLRKIALDGRSWPVAELNTGMLLTGRRGYDLWNPGELRVDWLLDAVVLDAGGGTLVWCAADCTRLAVRDLAGGREHTVDAPAPGASFTWAAISPDGRFVAATSRPEEVSAITLVDVRSGEAHLVDHPSLTSVAMAPAWSPDGSTLVVALEQGLFLAVDPTRPADLWRVPVRRIGGRWLHLAVLPEAGRRPLTTDLADLPVLADQELGRLAMSDQRRLTLLDLDSGDAEHHPLPRDAVGDDPPHSLLRRGDQLVVWQRGGPMAVDPARSPPHFRRLLDGHYFVPAAREDRIWVTQRLDSTVELAEIGLDGAVRRQAVLPPGHFPVTGWGEDDLLVRAGDGSLLRWSLRGGGTAEDLGEGTVLAAARDRLVWCPPQCLVLRVRNGVGSREIPAPTDRGFQESTSRLSPDLADVAVRLVRPGLGELREPAVVAMGNGALRRIDLPRGAQWSGAMTWSHDGRHLFLVGDDGLILAWRRGDARLYRLDVRFPVPPWHALTGLPPNRGTN